MKGIHSFSARRIFFPRVSEVSSTSTRWGARASATSRARGRWSSATGMTRTWVGESHTGSMGGFPASFSRWAFSRSA